ncbi:tetratricopeptide repeat protein [Flavobacteriaceae bacterium TP-CH-4]|uniref:Tetratricopeptide repeat protein n=1 Tax=Pelagihabitans pacificus TaxID=2696054 RepID=A0A967E618_9FLAO|nr:tetratricopeptide repeat protein [Pelagihabitans pacificus]NHF60032.1 tetratricopeptide repeat protein [Pelagihabitans pacificus]
MLFTVAKNFSLLIITLSSSFLANAQIEKRGDSLLSLYSTSEKIETRVTLLESLIDNYIYNDTEVAKSYIQELMTISQKSNYAEGVILGQLNLGYYYYTIEKMDSAYYHLNRTLEIAKEKNKKIGVVDALSNLSLVQGHKGQYEEAIRLMDSVAQLYLDKGDYLNYGVSINNSAAHYYDKGDYLKAMQGYRKALKILDTITREPYRKADILRNIGKLNTRQGNLDQALKYFELALETYLEIEDHVYAASTYSDIGAVHSDLDDEIRAIEFYKKGLEIGESSNNESVAIISLGNIGIAYKNLGNYDLAIENLKRCLSYDRDELSDINEVIYLYHLGNSFTYIKEYEIAESYLNEAIVLATKGEIGNELLNALDYRAYNFEQKGALGFALVDLKKSQIIRDSLFSLENAKQISELQTAYETEKKEAAIALQKEEINTLNEKAKVDTLTKGLYAGGMFSFVAVSGLLFFGFRQRIKKNRIAREKQEEIYKQEIEHKKKELASQTLHLVQKNTFIQELMDNLENIKNSPEKFKMEFRRIVMLLKKENASDKDWEVFKTYFAEVHNDFDQKLKTLYADISEKEIRLAAFLRMNLTTKEIAATLNVLPDSILKSKYRLKKKLGLDKEVDLTTFLNTL